VAALAVPGTLEGKRRERISTNTLVNYTAINTMVT